MMFIPHLLTEFLGPLQSFFQRTSVGVTLRSALQNLLKDNTNMIVFAFVLIGHNMRSMWTCCTYTFDVQWVACDPLHGLEQEAGQWHPFTSVV